MSDEQTVLVVTSGSPVATPAVHREVVSAEVEHSVLVETPVHHVVEVEQTHTVADEVPQVQVVTVGEIGPRGPAGPAGSVVSTVTRLAGEALGGHRVVVLNAAGKAVYATKADPSHAGKVLGVTTGAAAQDADATIQTYGALQDVSFSWTLDQEVYLNTNGQMTQTPPTTGFQRVIGFPFAADTLFIDLGVPVALAA